MTEHIPHESDARRLAGGFRAPFEDSTESTESTEQQHAEERLREREAEYRGIFEATGDGLIINDLESGVVVEANPAACRMHGYTRAEFVGLHPTRFIAPPYHDAFAAGLRDVRDGRSFQARAVDLHRDGTPFHVEVRGAPFRYRGAPHMLGIIRDVSVEAHAYQVLEERVEERTHELATLLAVSHDVAATLELQPLLGLILDQLARVVAYSAAAVFVLQGDQELRLLAYRGPLRWEDLTPHWSLQQAQHNAEVIRGREPVLIPDVRADTALARAFRAVAVDQLGDVPAYIASWMGVPLLLKDRVIGMLACDHDETGFYTPRHAALALAIANQAAVAMENARLYEQAQEVAALEERARLARELHDSVTQALFSMTLHARAAQMALERADVAPDERVARSVRQVSELAQGALAEMRALIFELRPDALAEEGLAAALHKSAAALSAREGVAVDVTTPTDRVPLAPAVEEHLYRLAQEALHNVVKHAQATHAWVRLALVPDAQGTVALEVQDDGSGFDTGAVSPGHLGLGTMAERARQLGGSLEIVSAPGQGTTVRAVAPGAVLHSPTDER